MGVSTHVIGIMEPTEDFKKKYAAWKACVDAGVDIPKRLEEYFRGEDPEPSGMQIQQRDLETNGVVEEYNEDSRDGYEIIVARIPKGVTRIRVYNSY